MIKLILKLSKLIIILYLTYSNKFPNLKNLFQNLFSLLLVILALLFIFVVQILHITSILLIKMSLIGLIAGFLKILNTQEFIKPIYQQFLRT